VGALKKIPTKPYLLAAGQIIYHIWSFNKEFKKFLRGKTLIKNFSNTKVVLVTTIPAQMPKPE
jgi:hypothetical protein